MTSSFQMIGAWAVFFHVFKAAWEVGGVWADQLAQSLVDAGRRLGGPRAGFWPDQGGAGSRSVEAHPPWVSARLPSVAIATRP
jgi:hypothetical protein